MYSFYVVELEQFNDHLYGVSPSFCWVESKSCPFCVNCQVFDSAWVKFDGKFHASIIKEEKLTLLKYYPELSSANEKNPAYILLAKGLVPLPETAIRIPLEDLTPNTNALAYYSLEMQMAP